MNVRAEEPFLCEIFTTLESEAYRTVVFYDAWLRYYLSFCKMLTKYCQWNLYLYYFVYGEIR